VTRIALMLDVLGDRRGTAGNVRHVLEIGGELRSLGHQVVLVAHDHDPNAAFEQLADGTEIRAVNVGPVLRPTGRRAILERYRVGMRRMAALVPEVDIVNPYDWPSLRAGRLAAERLRVPMIWTRNDDTIWERALIPGRTSRGAIAATARIPRLAFGLLDLRDARRAAGIVVLSEHDRQMARTAYRRPVEVLRIGSAQAFFEPPNRARARASLGLADDEFLVLAVALLVPHRRFEDLIEALALAPDPLVRGLLVGSDHLDPEYGARLAALIRSRGLGSRLALARSSVSDRRLRELYTAADVYVFPSSRQSYGQAPLEALAAGTPVIVSSGAGVSEILAGRGGVQIVAPGRPAELAEAIAATRAAGRSGAQETADWLASTLTNRAYAEAMAAIYAEAIDRRARRM
jgi:glycosyltransferase involved in cell wall biosynthesis